MGTTRQPGRGLYVPIGRGTPLDGPGDGRGEVVARIAVLEQQGVTLDVAAVPRLR